MKHDWVQCTPEAEKESKTSSGIIVAASFKPTKKATVVTAGPGSDLKKGEVVIHQASAGLTYEKDGKVFIMLRDLASEIIGVE
jgi:co-chaperonin GroES (HSP10)